MNEFSRGLLCRAGVFCFKHLSLKGFYKLLSVYLQSAFIKWPLATAPQGDIIKREPTKKWVSGWQNTLTSRGWRQGSQKAVHIHNLSLRAVTWSYVYKCTDILYTHPHLCTSTYKHTCMLVYTHVPQSYKWAYSHLYVHPHIHVVTNHAESQTHTSTHCHSYPHSCILKHKHIKNAHISPVCICTDSDQHLHLSLYFYGSLKWSFKMDPAQFSQY